MLASCIRELHAGNNLHRDQIREAVHELTSEAIATEVKATFLAALASKGETPDEIAEFARSLRQQAVPVQSVSTRAANIHHFLGFIRSRERNRYGLLS